MPTGLRWEREASGQIFCRRERSTGETVVVQAPCFEKIDFTRGSATVALTAGWIGTATGGGAAVAVADGVTDCQGAVTLTSDTANTGTDSSCSLSFSDSERLNVGTTTTPKYNSFECRLKIAPATAMNYQNVFLGLGGLNNLPTTTGIENIPFLVGFIIGDYSGTAMLPGNVDSLAVTAVLNDGSNATGTSSTRTTGSTGVTLVSGTYAIFRVRMNADKTVSYFINGTQVCTSTTFDASAVLSTEATCQPIIHAPRTTAAATGQANVVTVDYGAWWSIR